MRRDEEKEEMVGCEGEAPGDRAGAVYALGLGLLWVLVEPLLPWMVRLISSFLSFSFSFSSSFTSSFNSSFSLSGQASTVSSEAMAA